MFRVKICGIRQVEDAVSVGEAGGDAIGLNFFPGSKRFVDVSQASEIARRCAPGLMKVGVFVNASTETISDTCHTVGLDAVQLHGSERPEQVAEIEGYPVIKAFGVSDAASVVSIRSYVDRCEAIGVRLAGILVDSAGRGGFGGTGETAEWGLLARLTEQIGEIPLILAGGLNCENVGEAIAAVRPYGVDVASGVEISPGVKDSERVRLFISLAGKGLRGRGRD